MKNIEEFLEELKHHHRGLKIRRGGVIRDDEGYCPIIHILRDKGEHPELYHKRSTNNANCMGAWRYSQLDDGLDLKELSIIWAATDAPGSSIPIVPELRKKILEIIGEL